MERLNWAVLGLIGIVTALGLGTSSGAGKTKSDAQPVAVAAATSAPACDACRIAQAEAATKVAATLITTNEICQDNCQAAGVCCDKSMSTKDSVVSTTRTGEVYEFTIPADKQPAIPTAQTCEGECCLSKKSAAIASAATDCPLTKAADALASLTKQYACEGGECLTKPSHGTLTITAVEPASEKPEGLSNLLAAAEVTAAAQADQGPVSSTITISGEDLTKAGAGTLTLSVKAAEEKPGVAVVTETKAAEAKPAIDNSRAAARAAKLAKIEAKLEAPWELEIEKITLEELASAVQQKYGVPVIIDRKALEEAAFVLQTPINVVKQPQIEAGDYLRGSLEDQGLTWIIPASNDRVLITTRTAEQNTLINRVYDVSEVANSLTDPETLVERIQMLIDPTSWRASGGMGDLGLVQNGDKVRLIALNGYWVQRQVAEMLADLRLGNDNTAAPRGREKETSAVMRRHQLPGVGLIDDVESKRKLLVAQKRLLINLLKQTEGFDSTVFEIVDFNNEPVLMTKQFPVVHRQIAETIHSLQPKGPISGFGSSCDYGDFEPGEAGTGKLPGSY